MFNLIVTLAFIHLSIGGALWMFGYCSGRIENAVSISAARRGLAPTTLMMLVASLAVIVGWPGCIAWSVSKHSCASAISQGQGE